MQRTLFLFTLFFSFLFCAETVFLQCQESSGRRLVQFQATWGGQGKGPGQFKEPRGISVDPRGFLYVADTGNQRIQKMDSNGGFVTEVGGFGWEKEQFDGPLALSARNGLDVFVADYNNHRIERYDKDLHYLASFRSSEEWSEHHKFGFPMGVDLSFQGELFCVDGENYRVLKLDVLGNPQISFGDFDAGEGRLVQPQRIVVSEHGKVYVSDEEGGRVVVFDIHGNYLFTLGEGILERPVGMCKAGQRFLFVADVKKAMVFVFQEEGGLVESFGGAEEGGVRFQEPVDVTLWKERIYVLDKKRCAVDLFRWKYSKSHEIENASSTKESF